MAGRLDMAPPVVFGGFRGPETTIQYMRKAILGPRGERSVLVRSVTERVVQDLQPKDYLGEILAVRNYVGAWVRYLNDPISTEWVKDPQRMIEEIQAQGRCGADCDEICSLIITMCRQCGREAEAVTVGFGPQGAYSHVFARVREPKSGVWIVADPVAGTNEARMLRRVTTWRAWRID